nr:MAG TPA: hypothetical protein [Caudoviricetes sp.]
MIRYRWSKYFWCQYNIPFQLYINRTTLLDSPYLSMFLFFFSF